MLILTTAHRGFVRVGQEEIGYKEEGSVGRVAGRGEGLRGGGEEGAEARKEQPRPANDAS